MNIRYPFVFLQRLIVRRCHTLELSHAVGGNDVTDTRYLSRSRTKVAIFFGYVGTKYRGLQIQRNTRTGTTVELHLKNALFRAGCIHPKNMEEMHRIKWNRSSRTDAGVHALSTVCSARLLLSSEISDDLIQGKGGLELVHEVNQYLPEDIRVFGFSKVSRKWRARRACNTRTYHYYLSPHALGMSTTGIKLDDFQKLETFRSVLSMFEGRRPFHNFIGSPNQYSHYNKNLSKNEWDNLELYGEEEEIVENYDSLEDLRYSGNETAIWIDDHKSLHPRYHIGGSHFRYIHNFTCNEVRLLCPSSDTEPSKLCPPPVLLVSVTGQSFMMNQIRHMIGTAIAVMNGAFPIELIQPALLLPLRLKHVPLAPAEPLVLAGCGFIEKLDPQGELNKLACVQNCTNEQEKISDPNIHNSNLSCVLSNRKQFRRILEDSLQPFTQAKFWDKWLKTDMYCTLPSQTRLSDIYTQATQWTLDRQRIREERSSTLKKNADNRNSVKSR